jgi:hypothetical protein
MYEITPGQWQLYSNSGHRCMNVKGNSGANGAAIIQYTCSTTAANNLWRLDRVTNVGGLDWYRIRSVSSNKCLNVPDNSTTIGVNLIQYACGASRGNDLFSWGPA